MYQLEPSQSHRFRTPGEFTFGNSFSDYFKSGKKITNRMKTPEECLDSLAAAYGCPDVSLTETIQVIQFDAYKAGLSRAAGLLVQHMREFPLETHACMAMAARIEEVRGNLKPDDMK